MSFSNAKTKRKKKEPTTRQLCSRCDAIVTLRMWDLTESLLAAIWMGTGLLTPWLSTGDSGACVSNPLFVMLCLLGFVTFLVGIVAPACWFQLFRDKRQLVQSCCGLTCVLSAIGIHHTLACEQPLIVWMTGQGMLVRVLYGLGGTLLAQSALRRLKHPLDPCRKCAGEREERFFSWETRS